MFTGLVEAMGSVEAVEQTDAGTRLSIQTNLTAELDSGNSIAVDGVCLTAIDLQDSRFTAELSHETLDRSALAALKKGSQVNLELPVRAHDRLGGHIVQGHVDGVGEITSIEQDGFSVRMELTVPKDLMRYVVEKGSIALSGVSLTVADLTDTTFAVALIPETLQRTTLGKLRVGDKVNVEVDVLAKYVEKLLPHQ